MEIKELTDKIQNTWEQMKAKNDEVLTKAEGYHAEYKGTFEKMSNALDEQKKQLDDLEVKMQRQALPGAGAPPSPEDEKKAAHKAAFYKYVRSGDKALNPEERKALVEDTTGQYIVEPELDAEIVRRLPKITLIRGLATVRPIGSDRLKLRSMGEVSVGWGKLETGTEIAESTLVPGVPTYQYVEDLYGLTKIGEDELMDTDVNLQALLADSFSQAIGEEEDKQFVIGDGHALEEPEGITINATLVAGTKTTAAAGAVTFEELLGMIYGCPAQYRKNGVFIVNSTLELALRQIRATTYDATHYGQFIWQPSVQAGAPNLLLGYPIYNQDDMLDLSGAAAVIAIFGDLKAGYRIIDRAGITLQRLDELYAEAGLIGFKVHKRVSGAVMRASQKPIVLLTEHA